MALDFVAGDLVVVLGSRDQRQPGRIVRFDDHKRATVAVTPATDPDLVALAEGVLVVRSRGNGFQRLEGYSLTELLPGHAGAFPASLGRVRATMQGHGTRSYERCSLWKTSFDAMAALELARIPDWEHQLAILLHDRDDNIQIAAVAAGVHLRSPAVAKALMSLAFETPSVLARSSSAGGSRTSIWWMEIGEREEWLRELSAMALAEMRFEEAITPLGKLLLENPIPGFIHESDCSPLATAVCNLLNESSRSEAHAALARYNERIGDKDAWRALCFPSSDDM